MERDDLKTKEARIQELKGHSILEAIGNGVRIQDTDFRIIYQNKIQKDLLGDHSGEYCYKAYPHRESVCEDCPVVRVFQDGKTYTTARDLPADKGAFWFEVTASPLKDSSGETIAALLITKDITARKKIEELLTRERQHLISIFDSIDEVIYVADPDTYEILYLNNALRQIVGDALGQKCYKVFQGMDSPCPFCTNDRIFGQNTGKSYIWEFQNRLNQRWYKCIDKAINWPDRGMVRYEMAIDLTERKSAEDELKKKICDLEKFYEMAVGRELRMKELKEDIMRLKAELMKNNKPK